MNLITLILMIATSAFVFAGVFVPIYAIFRYPVPDEPPVHRQIAQAVGADRETVFENNLVAPILSMCMQVSRRLNVAGLRAKVRQDLNASGNPSGYTVDQHLALCLFASLSAALLGAVLDVLLLGGQALLMTIPIMAVIGFALPLLVLGSQATSRVQRISKQLPYTLDLIALVMAAGSAFTEALETLIRDDPEEDLNQELQLALSEIEYGSTRAQALKNLAERIPLESLRGVVGAVNQAESLGTPLASILKLQSDMLRTHRGVRAEKLSASASLKILIPSMLILMAVILVICAPLAINFIVKGSIF
ncbi:MAG: type II secretion system F family protein [Planctomycetota bacterium]